MWVVEGEEPDSPHIQISGTRQYPSPWKAPSIQDRKGIILSAMWKPTQSGPITPSFTPDTSRPVPPAPAVESTNRVPASTGEQATIGKGLIIKGDITGSESLYIDGKVEGSISIPGNRVTVGRNGQVSATINAREIVILGKVRGNVIASDRVDIRAEGGLTGDVTAARISIEDGAFFKGGIDIKKAEIKPVTASAAQATAEAPKQTVQA
jgi:cytoskeletal protein CcmA (bactofilin family)